MTFLCKQSCYTPIYTCTILKWRRLSDFRPVGIFNDFISMNVAQGTSSCTNRKPLCSFLTFFNERSVCHRPWPNWSPNHGINNFILFKLFINKGFCPANADFSLFMRMSCLLAFFCCCNCRPFALKLLERAYSTSCLCWKELTAHPLCDICSTLLAVIAYGLAELEFLLLTVTS